MIKYLTKPILIVLDNDGELDILSRIDCIWCCKNILDKFYLLVIFFLMASFFHSRLIINKKPKTEMFSASVMKPELLLAAAVNSVLVATHYTWKCVGRCVCNLFIDHFLPSLGKYLLCFKPLSSYFEFAVILDCTPGGLWLTL